MVAARARAARAGVVALAIAAAALAVTACASIWGFEPLHRGSDASAASDGEPTDVSPSDAGLADGTSIGPDGSRGGDGGSSGGPDARLDAPADGMFVHPGDASCPSGGGADCGEPTSSLTCESSGIGCACSYDPPQGNGLPCSPASLGVDASDVVCCADPAYPQGGSCTCWLAACTTSSGMCTCAPTSGPPGGACVANTWSCCLQTSAPGCLCSSLSCGTFPDYVDGGNACGIGDLLCGGVQKRVSSCN